MLGNTANQKAGHHFLHRREIVDSFYTLDSISPVLRLAGTATLEPHQRAHRIAPLVVRDIDADHRPWNDWQAEIAAQGKHRVGRPLIDVEGLDLEAVEQMARVLIGELNELRGRAALRHRELDAGRQLAERIQIGGRKRQHDALGALLEREVIAHQERAQHCAFGRMLDVLQKAMLARDEPAIPNAEDDSDRVVPVTSETDRVGVATSDDLHRLRLLELIQPLERVAELRRALVVLHVAGLVHALAQPGAHFECLPRKEQEDVIDHAPVILDALIADARRLAALDMKVQTGPVRRLLRQMPRAGPHREYPADNFQRLP